ncbi:MAG: lytic transglycosylase domain-containing protein [Thermodesulfobacteriota bacterium]
MRPHFSPNIGLCLALLAVTASPAAADIYTFIDAKGTVHFSNAPYDSRFNDKNHVAYLRKYRKQADIREYDYFIRESAEKYELDPHLIKAVVEAESNFDSYAVSHRGARGLMQLMPATAGDMQVKNSFNARQNIEGGCRYLRRMLDMFGGNIKLALAAYNAGPANVKKYKNVPPFAETKNYVRSVLRKYQSYKNKKLYLN